MPLLMNALVGGDEAEPFEGGFEVVNDFLGDHVGIWKIGGISEGFVFECPVIFFYSNILNQFLQTEIPVAH